MIKKYILETYNTNWITISGQDSSGKNLTYFEIVPIAKKSIPVFQFYFDDISGINDYAGIIIGANMSQSYMINIERWSSEDSKEKIENVFQHNKTSVFFRDFINIIFENTAQNIQISKTDTPILEPIKVIDGEPIKAIDGELGDFKAPLNDEKEIIEIKDGTDLGK